MSGPVRPSSHTLAALKRLSDADVPTDSLRRLAHYLEAFGYVNRYDRLLTDDDVASGLRKFQRMFGIPLTGRVDGMTLQAVVWPRCGYPDHWNHRPPAIKAVVDSQRPRWMKTSLTVRIVDYLPRLDRAMQRQVFARAWESWTRHGRLRVEFVRSGDADILIKTGRGPQSFFDGPGGTLAWAYLPDGSDRQLEVRFDLDEKWLLEPGEAGFLLLNVAAHEFGHLLGLDHSRVSTALMAPFYNPHVAEPQDDDIARFRSLYDNT